MVCPYLKNKGSAVRFCLWPLMRFDLRIINISNIKRITFRHDINGLRAVAVLAVIFITQILDCLKVDGWVLISFLLSLAI